MATKLYDLRVVTGKYTNNQGQQRNFYTTIGAVMQSESGGKFITINRTFNPAGVPNSDGQNSIIVGLAPVKDDNAQQSKQNNTQKQQRNDFTFDEPMSGEYETPF